VEGRGATAQSLTVGTAVDLWSVHILMIKRRAIRVSCAELPIAVLTVLLRGPVRVKVLEFERSWQTEIAASAAAAEVLCFVQIQTPGTLLCLRSSVACLGNVLKAAASLNTQKR
jgi:hypothetical protein